MTTARQPSFLGPEVDNITDINLVRPINIELPIQHIVKDGLLVIAVCRDLLLYPTFNLHAGFFHQLSRLIPADWITESIERFFTLRLP